jgi:hypothetical protein
MGDKDKKAIALIQSCFGKRGIWASTIRYKNQCWTRDFCLATCPLLLNKSSLFHDPNKVMNLIQRHLLELAQRQKPNGKIPILYLDNEVTFVEDKTRQSKRTGKQPFMLQRYLKGELENLTPHTRDSEVLFIITVHEFLKNHVDIHIKETLIKACSKALEYVRNILKNNLIPGADWRDTRDDLDHQTVLTNACLLYQAYLVMNQKEEADQVAQIIKSQFWNHEFFLDYHGSNNFDLIGNSLAVLFDLANENQRELIFQHVINNYSSPFGFIMKDTFLPALSEEEKLIMASDKAVIWPFTNGFMLHAMIIKGNQKWKDIAQEEFKKWEKLDGFYEWYDIRKGQGYGSVDQVWSAALYLRTKLL